MIQRIQTVYLFIVALVSFPTPFLISEWNTVGAEHFLAYNSTLSFGFFHAIAFLSFVSIFLYKFRKHQMTLIKFVMLLDIILFVLYSYWFMSYPNSQLLSIQGLGLATPIISIFLLSMAHNAIKNDIELVRSMDRIR